MDVNQMAKIAKEFVLLILAIYEIIRIDFLRDKMKLNNNNMQHALAIAMIIVVLYVPLKVLHSILDVFYGKRESLVEGSDNQNKRDQQLSSSISSLMVHSQQLSAHINDQTGAGSGSAPGNNSGSA